MSAQNIVATGPRTHRVRAPGAFNPLVVLVMLLVGSAAFIATLYFIGSGQSGKSEPVTGGYAYAKGLNGYAALAGLLEKQGRDVIVADRYAQLEQADMLVLTPPSLGGDTGKEIGELLEIRRNVGPTIVILPKWRVRPMQASLGRPRKPGWVDIVGTLYGRVEAELGSNLPVDLRINNLSPSQGAWRGLDVAGRLPAPQYAASIESNVLTPLVTDDDGGALVAFYDIGTADALLYEAPATSGSRGARGNASVPDDDDYTNSYDAPFIIVAEPDLMNNFGMADKHRAQLALNIIDLAAYADGYDEDTPVTFDVTLNGMGRDRNLLTLAFKPPFLAATLCLILAAVIVGWRAFARFGPPIAEGRAIAFGKERLVANSAGLVLRGRRFALLKAPYAELIRRRLSRLLGIRRADDEALDAALARRGLGDGEFSERRNALEQADGPKDILRAAQHLKNLEERLSE